MTATISTTDTAGDTTLKQSTSPPVATPTTATTQTCTGDVDSYPTMPGDPAITIQVVDQTATLECTIQSATEDGSEYAVTWTTAGTTLGSTNLTTAVLATLTVNGLNSAQKESVIDNGVTCSVTARNPARCGNGVSPALSASLDAFKPVVTVPEDKDVIEGNTTFTVQVAFGTITPDLYCFLKYEETCTVTIQARTAVQDDLLNKCGPNDPVPVIAVKSVSSNGQASTCGGVLSSSNSNIDLMLRAISDAVARPDRIVKVRVAQIDTPATAPQQESVLKSFDLTVKSDPITGSCKIIGDPHIFTYDGEKYDNMMAGEFIFYRHKVLDVEIHGYLYVVGSGSSACGFSARIGSDVVIINKCETRGADVHPVTARLYRNGNENRTPMFKVIMEDDGETYKIFLPSGAMLIVRNSIDASVNAFIVPSAKDINNIDGACGSFDGNKLNDLIDANGVQQPDVEEPNAYSNSWRVPEGASIYSGFTGTSTLTIDKYCTCDLTGQSECTQFGDVAPCDVTSTDVGEDITETLLQDSKIEQVQQIVSRRKRATTTTSGGFTYETNSGTPTQTITNADATTACTNAVESMDSYATCVTYSQDAYAGDISDCVDDVVRTGSTSWATSTVQSLEQSCREAISSNATQWTDTDPTNAQVQPTLNPVINQLCPNDCTDSSRGTCNSGKCTCKTGYIGSDCSTSASVDPTILIPDTSRTCALNLEPCNATFVSGVDFLQGAECLLTPIIVSTAGFTEDGSVIRSPANYRTSFRVLCELPDKRSYSIRLTNDGSSSSDTAYFVAHEECFECQIGENGTTPTCTQKSDYCFIDNTCYKSGAISIDSCKICSPAKSATTWSLKDENRCNVIEPPTTSGPTSVTTDLNTDTTAADSTAPPTTEAAAPSDDSVEFNSLTVIIVSSSIAGVLLTIIVIFAAVLTIRRRRLKAATQMSSTVSEEDESYQRVFNGSFGLRTDKNLTFYNPSLTPSYEFYDNSI